MAVLANTSSHAGSGIEAAAEGSSLAVIAGSTRHREQRERLYLSLFEELNHRDFFPEGMLYWNYPLSGKRGALQTTAPGEQMGLFGGPPPPP